MAAFPPVRLETAARKGGEVPAGLGGLRARGRGTRARPRARGDERAAASGGAQWRRAFPARVAHEPEEKEVGDVD